MKNYFLYLFLFVSSYLLSQNTNFIYSKVYNKRQLLTHVIETKDKNYIVVINNVSDSFGPPLLIKLNRSGQLIKSLMFQKDNHFFFIDRIIELDSTILSMGGAYNKISKQSLLFIGQTDKNLNATTFLFQPIPDVLQNINYDFDRDSNIIIGGGIQFKKYYTPRLFGAKLDKKGNFVSFTVKTPIDTPIYELSKSPYYGWFDAFKAMKDSSRYVYFDGHKIVVVDTSFNAVYKLEMPYIDSISWGLNPSVLRLNDSTYCMSTTYRNNYQTSAHRDFYFLITTLSRRVKTLKTFGSRDTIEWGNNFSSLDTNYLGQFYFGGTFNDQRFDSNYPFSQDTSQFVLYKLDKNYNLLWTKRYGKNAVHEMQGLLATSDGGCLMYGYRYDYNTIPQTEAYIVKVDANGLISSETSIPLSISTVYISPNPSTGSSVQINLAKDMGETDVQFFDLSGRLTKTVHLTAPDQTFDISDLPTGQYVFHVVDRFRRPLSIGKFVKL